MTANDDLKRFYLLSKFIVHNKPDIIILMGDFLTLDSLNFFDKGKIRKLEGKRYKKEIDVGNKALDIIFGRLTQLQNKQRKQKIKIYNPEIIFLEGNHCFRCKRYLDIDPTFDGFISIENDLNLKKYNIKYIPYMEYIEKNGVLFTHIPFNRWKDICGVNITKKAQAVVSKSCVFAHTHTSEYENFQKHGQDDLQQILSVGCFFENNGDYIAGRVTEYWKGLILLNIFDYGRFDFQTFSMERLKSIYQ